MTEPLRWGVLSTGRIAHTFASDLRFTDQGVVVAVGSRSRATADAFGDEFDIPHRHDSYEALVSDDDVDAVYVGTPHPMHFANAMLALEHRKPVLVEKAFTMTAQEARDLVGHARSTGLFLMEAMWTRFLPHVVALRELVSQGALGEIVTFEADHGQWFEIDPTSRLFAPELGGGALLDLGVYPVSFASMLLGTPSRLTALVDSAFSGVDGQASMLFGYANGAHAVLTCTSSARTPTRACVSGTRARVEIDGDFYAPSSFSLIDRDGHAERYEFDSQGRGLHYQVDEVARCLRAGLTESPVMPLDESVAIMQTMESVLSFLQ
ncbi:MAG TPA: Gfo/Idh/MocA family oxidoreductase [Acidimicrobiales bacterium]|nr:Gfo/Idh/MocA family oxidoreductase [Acidimicrobiales bacterium]